MRKRKISSVYVRAGLAAGVALLLLLLVGLAIAGYIHPRQIRVVIRTESNARTYNGEALTAEDYSILSGELLEGHTLTMTYTGMQTRVGTSDNTAVPTVIDESGYDVTDAYDFEMEFGTLTVTPAPLVVSTEGAYHVYDGTPLTNDAWQIEKGALALGESARAEVIGTQTTVGTCENELLLTVYDALGRETTDQYEITYMLGTLEVVPRRITVSTASNTKYYDGTPVTAKGWDISSGTVAPNETVNAKTLGEQRWVGKSTNELYFSVENIYGVDTTAQYEITYDLGTLEVTPRSITISTPSAERIYDGTALTNHAWEIVNGSVADGETVDVTVTGAQNVVGQSSNSLRVRMSNAEGEDVTNQYDIKYEVGTLTVTPRRLAIRSGSATKTYDGTALTCSEWELIAGSLADGHDMEVTFGGTQTEVGTSDNHIVYVMIYSRASGDRVDVTENYRLEFDYGTLYVKPQRP